MSADTLIVLISLLGAGPGRTAECLLTEDSTLWLPAADVHALLGLPTPPAPWTTTEAVLRDWPTVTASWDVRSLAVVFLDPLNVLPASRAVRARQDRAAHGAPPLAFVRSGPFASVAGDERGRYLADLGYSWRGRVALAVRKSSERGTTWNLGVSPIPQLFASVSGAHIGVYATPRVTSASARLAVGPAWVSTTWTPGRWHVDALTAWGPVSVFASSRDQFFVTIRSQGVDFQAGRNAELSAFRISVGPFRSSPFTFPTTF